MSERFEHRDHGAYEYTLERELARRRARGCAKVLYWGMGALLVLVCFGVMFLVGVLTL